MDVALDVLAIYLAIAKQAILIIALLIALSSIDDVVIDILYVTRGVWRRWTIYNRFTRASASDLAASSPQWMAILLPAWDESAVLADMLRSTLARVDYPAFRLFVGVYPNDPATIQAAFSIAQEDTRINVIITDKLGPTTKADCLNQLYSAALAYEKAGHPAFCAFILHDAEDVIHPGEFNIFNHLIPRKAMVQVPVVPLAQNHSPFIAGSYLDEFAEFHTKDLVVREWLGAGLPSAGVGCAFSREAFSRAAQENNGVPFRTDSVTEDYELGVRLSAQGLKAAFVRIPSTHARRGFVATREFFPDSLKTAVRQRARWLLGIALQGWERLGWQGSFAHRYMLMRDRKALLNAYLNMGGYWVTLHVVLLWLWPLVWKEAPTFPPLMDRTSFLSQLLILNILFLGWRLAMRVAFTTVVYGPWQGLLAAPRAVVSNLINFLAASRALKLFLVAQKSGQATPWDKTAHRFPDKTQTETV